MVKRLLVVVILISSISISTNEHTDCWGAEPNRYDVVFAVAEILTGLDGCKLKAQAITENSTLDPYAKSHVGATGCSQFMPRTWKDINKRYGVDWSINDCVASILMQSFYMAEHYQHFLEKGLSEDESWNFALAAYNRGRHGLLRSLPRRIKNLAWNRIKNSQPVETMNYVRKATRLLRVWTGN